MNVPVGPTTKVSWGASASAIVAAVIVYLTGTQSAQETTALELAVGGFALIAFAHGFRYLQSLVGLKIEPEAPPIPVSAQSEVKQGTETAV